MNARAALVVLLAAVGCHNASVRTDEAPAVQEAPVITRISPDSGFAGTAYPIEITIEGRGFADTNVVLFGPVTVKGVPARDSRTHIVLLAPKEQPSASEVPPSPLQPGEYQV